MTNYITYLFINKPILLLSEAHQSLPVSHAGRTEGEFCLHPHRSVIPYTVSLLLSILCLTQQAKNLNLTAKKITIIFEPKLHLAE